MAKGNKIVNLTELEEQTKKQLTNFLKNKTKLDRASVFLKPGNYLMVASIIRGCFYMDKLHDAVKEQNINMYKGSSECNLYVDSRALLTTAEHFLGGRGALSPVFSDKAKIYDLMELAIENTKDVSEDIQIVPNIDVAEISRDLPKNEKIFVERVLLKDKRRII